MTTEKQPIAWNTPGHLGKTPKVMLMYLMTFFAMGMFPSASYMASLPTIQAHLGMSDTLAQTTVAAFLVTMGFGSMIFGPIGHHLGRKKSLLLTCIIFMIGSLLCIKATSATVFMIGRLIQGVGATGLMTLGRTIIRDVFSHHHVKTISGYTVPMGPVAIATAPLVGGYLHLWFDWQGIFWFAFIVYGLLALSIALHFPETQPQTHRQSKPAKGAYRTLLKSPIFYLPTTSAGLAMGFVMSYHAISPFLLRGHLGHSVVAFGWLGFLSVLSILTAIWLNHRFMDRWDNRGLLNLGTGLLFLAALSLLLPGTLGYLNTPCIVLPFMLGLIGAVLSFINGFSVAINPWPHLASFASALYNTWQCTTACLIAMVAAWMPETSQMPMAYLWLATGSLQMLLVYRLTKTQTPSCP